jgi:type IV secretion system protein VirB10
MSDHQSPVELGASDVSGPRGKELTLRQKLAIAVLLGIVALCVIWFNALVGRHAPAPEKSNVTAAGIGQKYTPPPVIPVKAQAADLPLPADSTAAAAAMPQTNANPPAIFAYSGGGTAVAARPEAMPLQVIDPGASAGTGTEAPPATTTSSVTADSSLARKLKPTVLSGATASVVKNPDMVITEGTVVPCTLQTAINTQLAGFVTCVIPVDVRGTSGNVVLLDRGTKIVGQIESGLIQGQDRVFVLWTRAETPNHVIISLNAPGADELGRAGLPGAVDNHWWDRFGGALMLTLVQGSLNAGTALAANSGGNSNGAALGYVYSAQSAGGQVANTALENSINIPPTLNKNQGDTVSVFVVQDLDFSGVYGLKLSGGAHVP